MTSFLGGFLRNIFLTNKKGNLLKKIFLYY